MTDLQGKSDRAIISGVLRVAGFVVIAKIMIALRDVAIAWQFGAGALADAFNVAFAMITWLPLFLAAAIGSALVPVLMRADKQVDRRDATPFIDEISGHACALAFAVTIISVLIAWLTKSALEHDSSAIVENTFRLMLAFAPFAGLTTLFYFLANRLQACGNFSYSMFEGLPGLIVAICVAAFGEYAGLSALAIGTLLGGLLQVLILAAQVRRERPDRVCPRLTRTSENWSLLLSGIGLMAVGQALLSLVVPIDQYFAAQAGPGVPATFGYASRMLGLATSVGTLVLGRALLPTFADMLQRNPALGNKSARKWAGIAFFLGVLGAAVGWIAAQPIVELLFERGSFTRADTLAVAHFIKIGLFQLPFFFSGIAAVQWLIVCGRFLRVTIICAVTVAVKGGVLWIMLPRLGTDALILSTVAMYFAAWILQTASLSSPIVRAPPVG